MSVSAYLKNFVEPGKALELSDGTHYQIEQLLGTGAHACVFRAARGAEGLEVTLRVTLLDAQTAARQLEEALMQSVEHPHIQRCLGFHVEERFQQRFLFMDMEFMEETLSHLVAGKQLPADEAVSILVQLASAVSFMHARNVIHRDLKLENVLANKSGKFLAIKLADFDLARSVTLAAGDELSISRKLTSIGTPHYAAPEVWNEVDYDDVSQVSYAVYSERVDEWALGVIAYELCLGRKPFDGNAREIQEKIQDGLQSCEVKDARLNSLCMQLLQLEDRRPSIRQVFQELFSMEILEMGLQQFFSAPE